MSEQAEARPKLPGPARLALGLGLGILLALNSSQGSDPVLGLGLFVVWPVLFCLGLAAGLWGGRFVPQPGPVSAAATVRLSVLLAVAMAVFPCVRGVLYLREVAALLPVYPGAEVVDTKYNSPLLPRFVALELRTDQAHRPVFDYYDRQLFLAGWRPDSSSPPYSGSWVKDRRDRIQLFITPFGAGRSGLLVQVIWTREMN